MRLIRRMRSANLKDRSVGRSRSAMRASARSLRILLLEPTVIGLCFVGFAVLVFLAGRLATMPGTPIEVALDAVYQGGRLVGLEIDVPEPGDWWGRVARFLAMLALVAFGFEVIRTVSANAVERMRVLWRRAPWFHRARRVAIIGSTRRADWLARGVAFPTDRSSSQVGTLVTQVRDQPTDEQAALGPLLVVTEPIIDAAVLVAHDIDRADEVIISCDDDALALGWLNTVLALPVTGASNRARTVRVQLGTPEVLEEVRSAGWDARSRMGGGDGHSDVRVWNPGEIAARRAMQECALDWRHPFAERGGSTELICIGFGTSGRLLANVFMRLAHHVDENMCRITSIDEQPDRAVSRFRSSFPRLDDVARIESHQLDAFDPRVREIILQRLADPHSYVIVSVAVGIVDQNLSVALGLSRALAHSIGGRIDMPMFVRQSDMLDVKSLFARFRGETSAPPLRLVPWGGLDDACRPEDVLESRIDRRAERIHEMYLTDARARARAEGKPPPVLSSDPLSALRPWRELWSFYRDDNRNRADFLTARLRAVGLRIAQAGEAGERLALDQLEPADREVLARLEHRRWVVSRLLGGWTRGQRDNATRRHPSICSWGEIDDAERRKDDVGHDLAGALVDGEGLVRLVPP